ncbi:MAG: ATP-binding protein [Desulfobacterales bacterium]|nr:ATP-binding protein [Desulfobacterales bacterium]
MDTLSFKLKSDMSELDTLLGHLNTFSAQIGLTRKCFCQINLALEELFTNIVSYGQDNQTHPVKVDITYDKGVITIRIEDRGIAFDPIKAKKPDTKCSLKDRQIGGLGIHLIKNLMDEINYQRKNNKNILTIKKRIEDLNCC